MFNNIFEWRGQMPAKGLKRCQLFALGAIVLYQIVLLYQHPERYERGLSARLTLSSHDRLKADLPADTTWYGTDERRGQLAARLAAYARRIA